ncbi:MAG: glycosyltransferase family 9 protein [candidate division Zixibacteria bacterium]|nr:glycosyltransferase family 9 protein [Candidatus Tariuqbacter arcticus]
MNLDLIRFTDKYLGTPLRLLLYYYQKIRDLFPQRTSREPYKHILVVKFWGIGNIVRASPAFKAIRDRFPEARITFITLSQNRGACENSELFDEVIYLRLKTVRTFLWDVIRKFFILRREKFDLALDLEPWANFAEIVSFYIAAGMRVGFTAPGRRSLYNIRVPFKEDEHISKSFFRILYPFGLRMPNNLLPLPIPISSEDRNIVHRMLEVRGVRDEDFTVAVNVNASDVADARRWPSDRFARLADRIAEELEAKTIFIGAPNERPLVQEVIDMMRSKGLNFAGQTTLEQAVALLDRGDIFVTNDSGPMHIAMAMGTPTVALFGPETPKRYGPLSDMHIAIFKNYDCSPCITFAQAKKIKCKFDAKCIKEISVDEVFEGVKRLYRRLNPNPA